MVLPFESLFVLACNTQVYVLLACSTQVLIFKTVYLYYIYLLVLLYYSHSSIACVRYGHCM